MGKFRCIDDFLQLFPSKPRLKIKDGYNVLCPIHDDKKPSLSVVQKDNKILIHCQAGCDSKNILQSLGLTMADLSLNKLSVRKVVAIYDYHDENGKFLFQAVRFEPKAFAQRHKDESGNWVWNLKGVRRVLYRLPEILVAPPDKPVLFVEGEKDVEALRQAGLVATTSPGGVNGWKAEYAQAFIGKRVTLIPDNDTMGYEYANQVARDLISKAKELKCILLPNKDISDWLNAGGDIKTLPSLEQDIAVLLNPEKQVKVTQTITGYRFHWVAEDLRINVSRVRIHTDGRITGDIQLILGQKEEPSFGWNFSSSQTRKILTNSLKEKYPSFRWQEIIDELCRQVQKLTLTGEPVRELWTSEEIQAPQYLLEPILLKDLPTIIFGEKGVTKSNLALVFYIILTLPWSDNPLDLLAPDHPIKTVILDWELPGNIAQWNLKKLQEGMKLPPLPLYHRRCLSPLADDIETIQKYILEIKAEAVIIDSLGRAVGGELLKDTENINRFFMALDKLNVTPLILAQTSKEGDAKGRKKKSIYGSTFFEYYARSIFELCKAESIGEDEVSVALFHRSANLTRLQKPMGFRFSFNEKKTEIIREAVNYPEFLEKVNRQFQILELLKRMPLKTDEIMEALEIKRGNADMTLKRLKDKQKVIKLEDGRWGLLGQQLI